MVHFIANIGDDALIAALDEGASNIADVCLNRRVRCPCLQCMEGKFRNKSIPPSVTPSATAARALFSFDNQALPAKSNGGNQHYLDSID